ncbi:MAG: hypothetical protein K9N47_11780 [Prosthecobacter sp.]|uniref:hypothetical protein n=1 Tax=Prosthecobacter sp. TaxID=1965333 RepID=UPI0025D08504|nr:hypothetical protein [Prosthecobacter sp.]MCF7786795.1 hypothetical protein [Prosthecobacter sp.]
MKTDPYYQFPISALSYGMNRDNRWNHVLYYACLHYGREAVKMTLPAVVESEVESFIARNRGVSRDRRIHDQTAILFAMARFGLNVPGKYAQDFIKQAEMVAQHCSAQPFPTVRIRTDFWWKTFTPANHKNPLSFREFSVLCAVYAIIGKKAYGKASVGQIRRAAAGLPSRTAFIEAELDPDPNPNVSILSTRQVRTTLDALEVNRFFAKFTYNRGECFYSNRLTRSQLSQSIEKRKLGKKQMVAAYRSLDMVTSQEIKQQVRDTSRIWNSAAA